MIGRRGFLTGAAALWAGGAMAQGRPVPRPQGRAAPATVEAAIAAAGLSGVVSYVLADAATGAILEAREADRPMPPASTMKALTAILAMDRLGADHRFATRIIATGPVAGGLVQGDLVLAGGGDPVLDSDDLAALAADLAAAGLRGVTGRFLIWNGAIPNRDQIAEGQPVHAAYNPAVTGLMLNFNRVHLEWRKAGGDFALTLDARAEAHVPQAHTITAAIAPRDRPLFTHALRAEDEHWTVASGALGQGGARWLPVRRPAAYAGDVFQTLARAQGITLPRAAETLDPPEGTTLARHLSPPLSEILTGMLRHSTNLTAEAVGLAATGARDQAASAEAMRDALWHQAPLGRAVLLDHSGLNGGSWITAAGMAQALALAGPGAHLPALLRAHEVTDAAAKPRKLPGAQVQAKTGTLNFCSNLVGYLTPPGGDPMVFAIFTEDAARRAAVAGSDLDLPDGVAAWTRRSKALQSRLLEIWAERGG